MKKILFCAACILASGLVAHAQLDQTKWKGRLLVPDEMDCWLSFRKDILEVLVSNGQSALETMTYAVARDTLFIKKLSGRSACDSSTIGTYKWVMNGDNLLITPLSDNCEPRYKAWNNQPFVRQRD